MWRPSVHLMLHWTIKFAPQPCQTATWSLMVMKCISAPAFQSCHLVKNSPPFLCCEKSILFASPLWNELFSPPPLDLLSSRHYFIPLTSFYLMLFFVLSPTCLCSARPSGPGKWGLGCVYNPVSLLSSFPPSPSTWCTFSAHRGIKLLNPVDCITMG